MKRAGFLIVCVLALSAITQPLQAQESAQALFDQANTLFEEGELSEAMVTYRQIEENGEVSGALYLNMGIVAVQQDSMGLAKVYFLRSSEFEETNERAEDALEYVESQFSRQSATLPKLPWDRAVEWLNNGPGASTVFVTGFLISLGGLCLLYLYWFGLLNFDKIQWYITGTIATGAIIALLSFYADYVNLRYHEAVLITEESRVMQGPSDDSNLVSLAYEGYNLTIDDWKSEEIENWLYIRLGNGQYGWIQEKGVRKL